MTQSVHPPIVGQLIARLTGTADHPRFTGAPLDLSTLDAHARSARCGPRCAAPRNTSRNTTMRTTIRAPNSRAGCTPRSTRSNAPRRRRTAARNCSATFRPARGGARYRNCRVSTRCPRAALQAELARILGEPQNDGLQRLSVYGKYALHAFAGQRDITALRDAYAQLNADSRFACASRRAARTRAGGAARAGRDERRLFRAETAVVQRRGRRARGVAPLTSTSRATR